MLVTFGVDPSAESRVPKLHFTKWPNAINEVKLPNLTVLSVYLIANRMSLLLVMLVKVRSDLSQGSDSLSYVIGLT